MTNKDTGKLFSDMNDARLINMGEHLLKPILKKHIEQRVSTMCSKFNGGETNFVKDVAQISYIHDLLNELKTIQIKGNKAMEKLRT